MESPATLTLWPNAATRNTAAIQTISISTGQSMISFAPDSAVILFPPAQNAGLSSYPQTAARRESSVPSRPARLFLCPSPSSSRKSNPCIFPPVQPIYSKRDNIQFCNCPSHDYYFTNSFTFAALPTRFPLSSSVLPFLLYLCGQPLPSQHAESGSAMSSRLRFR